MCMLKTNKQLNHKSEEMDIPKETMIIMSYGTLKRGFYNHKLMGENTYLGKVSLSGYVMYKNEHYPAIVKSDDPERVVIGELYEIEKDVFDTIAAIEFSAGYHINEIGVDINNEKTIVPVFVMDKELVDNSKWEIVNEGEYK